MIASPLFRSKWEQVSKDLGIEVNFDFCVTLPDGGELVAPAHLPQFGARRGMLLFTRTDDMWSNRDVLWELGFGYSVVGEPCGFEYDRLSTIDMLADWSWAGPAETGPGWLDEANVPEEETTS